MITAPYHRMSHRIRQKRILYLQYTNPAAYPPLQHSSRILADAGWQVRFLGTRAMGADALRFPEHQRIRVERMNFCPSGWRQKLHYLRYLLWSFWVTLTWRPRWVYASDPLSAPSALLAGLVPGVELLYHEHDSPSEHPGSRFMRWVLTLRRKLAYRADLVILPNAGRVDAFANGTGIPAKRIHIVWNCPARGDALPEPEVQQDGGMWLHYHGNVSPQLLPLAVIDALKCLPAEIKLRVIGYETVGTFGYLKILRERAHAIGVDARLELLDAKPRQAMLSWTRKADVGIALFPKNVENRNMTNMTGASNKPFDYLACGCPLLVSELPDWERMFVKSGVALCCDPENPESIAAAIRWYYEHPVERHSMGEAGRQRILKEWNYENQFNPVLVGLSESVGNDRAG